MRVWVRDISPESLSRTIFHIWPKYFTESGWVVEITIHTSEIFRLLKLVPAWQKIFEKHGMFVERSQEYPLVSFAIHVEPRSNCSQNKLINAVMEAWTEASRFCNDAHVVGQSFFAYTSSPEEWTPTYMLEALDYVFNRFCQIPFLGNLGHPPPERNELLFKGKIPEDWNIPPQERYMWESDLSNNTIDLYFHVDPNVKIKHVIEEIQTVFGDKKTAVEWVRTEYKSGIEVGKGVLSIGRLISRRYCMTSVQAAEHFLLSQGTTPINISSFSKNLSCLYTFCLAKDKAQYDKCTSEGFRWPVPDSQLFQNPIAIKIDYSCK